MIDWASDGVVKLGEHLYILKVRLHIVKSHSTLYETYLELPN